MITVLFHGEAKEAKVFFDMEQEYYYSCSQLIHHENIIYFLQSTLG